MKIIVVCGAGYISGKEKIMLSLILGLKENGHDVICVTSKWGDLEFIKLLILQNIPFYSVRLGFISKTINLLALKMTLNQLFYYPKLIYDFSRIQKSIKPDIIIHSNFHHLFLLFPILKIKYTKHFYHSHESILNTPFYQNLFIKFSQKIHLFVGVSNFVSNRLVKLGIPSNKVVTIHNGLASMSMDQKCCNREEEIFNIGIIGQIGGWKGHEDLINAVIKVAQMTRNRSFRVLVFGKQDLIYCNYLNQIITDNNISSLVEFKGFEKNISEIYNQLNLVCLPSRSEEPFATSALEPGLFSIPVIVSPNGGLPEIITNGYNGFIVNTSDSIEFAEKLIYCIQTRKEIKLIGFNHQLVVSTKFNFQEFINNWQVIFHD